MACDLACCFGIYHVTLYNSGIIISHINPMSSPSPVQPNPPSTPEKGQTAAVVLTPASRSRLRREADVCVSIRLTGANQAPIVARGVSRSFRAHHIDAALGLESDGMLRSRARYWCGWTFVCGYVAGLRVYSVSVVGVCVTLSIRDSDLVVLGLPVLKRRSLGCGDPKLSLLRLWGQSSCFSTSAVIRDLERLRTIRVLLISTRLSLRLKMLRVFCPSLVTGSIFCSRDNS